MTVAAQGQLPNTHALQKVIQRKRIRVQAPPPNPVNLAQFVIPANSVYREYEHQPGQIEPFLLAERGQGPNNIFIFGRHTNIDLLERSNRWYMDGTFKIAPNIFSQVFVLLAEEHGGVHPCVYGLLPDKARVTYDAFFDMLIRLRPNLNPTSISCDFEKAAFQAVSARFPNASIDGCFFHFVKNFKKVIDNNGMKVQYQNDPNFALMARMIPALAFVPVRDLDMAFTSLTQFLPAVFQLMLDWLEDNYLGRLVANNQRRQPSFPIRMWNVNDRVQQHIGRTNNFAEAAHRWIQQELQTDHRVVWKFIGDLKKVQKSRDVFREHLIAGNEPPKKLQRYIQCDQRIERMVTNYGNYANVLDFLRGIGHNFMMD